MHCDYRGDAAQTVTSTRPFCAAEGGQGGSGGPGELCDNSCADAVPGAAHLISYSMYKTALTPTPRALPLPCFSRGHRDPPTALPLLGRAGLLPGCGRGAAGRVRRSLSPFGRLGLQVYEGRPLLSSPRRGFIFLLLLVILLEAEWALEPSDMVSEAPR